MKYTSPFSAKLIYVFAIPDDIHRGCLKIGEATIPDGADLAASETSDASGLGFGWDSQVGPRLVVELFGSDANGRKMIAWGRR